MIRPIPLILMMMMVMIAAANAVIVRADPPQSSAPSAAAGEADDEEEAVAARVRSEVEAGIADALGALRDEEMTGAERRSAFKDVLEQRIDFEVVSRLAIGRPWRELSEEHRKAFEEEFTKHLLRIGGEAARQYRGEEVIILGDRRASETDWIVQTQIVRRRSRPGTEGEASRPVVNVDFRLRERDEEWRIIDARIAGVSMAAGFRSQFESVMRRGGIERIIEILRERNGARAESRDDRS